MHGPFARKLPTWSLPMKATATSHLISTNVEVFDEVHIAGSCVSGGAGGILNARGAGGCPDHVDSGGAGGFLDRAFAGAGGVWRPGAGGSWKRVRQGK